MLRIYTDACTYKNGQEGQDSSYAIVLDDGTERGDLLMVTHIGNHGVNIAEYSGVIAALEWAHGHNERVRVFTDSAVVAGHMDGTKAVLTRGLVSYALWARELVNATGSTVNWVPRGQNLAGHYWERFHASRRKERVRIQQA